MKVQYLRILLFDSFEILRAVNYLFKWDINLCPPNQLSLNLIDISLCPPYKLLLDQMDINLCPPEKLLLDHISTNLCPPDKFLLDQMGHKFMSS